MGSIHTERFRPIGRLENAAVPTTGTAFAFPAGSTVAKVIVGGDAYVGIGPDDSPPAASTSNSAHLLANQVEFYTRDAMSATPTANPLGNADSHVYVYAVAGTVTAKISFYN